MIARGDFNVWSPIIGVNGCGKSTLGRELAAKWAARGVRVFVHDPDGQYRPWPLYTIRSWERAADEAHRKAQPMPLIARFEGAVATDVLDLAQRAAGAAGYVEPVLVVIDEGALIARKEQRERLDDALLQLLARRRNLGVGVVVLYQAPGLLDYLHLQLSTEIYLFRIGDEVAVRQLTRFIADRALLVDGRQVERSQILGKLRYLDRGEYFGIVNGLGESVVTQTSSSDT